MGLKPRQWRQLTVISLVVAGTIFLYLVRGILFPFWLALIFAYITNPAVKKLEERQVPRSVAIILVYVISIAVLAVLASRVVPRLVEEMEQIVVVLPRYMKELSQLVNSLLATLERFRLPIAFTEAVLESASRFQGYIEGFVQRLVDVLLGMFSRLFTLFLVPILAFYILRDLETFKAGAWRLVPLGYQGEVRQLIQDINRVLDGFIRGQIVVSAVVGLLIAICLGLLKVRFALLLGLVAGIFNLIPYLGPLLGGIPATIFALLDSEWKAVWTIVIFTVINNVEGSIIAPRIIGDSVGLHPLTMIFVVLAGGHLFGVGNVAGGAGGGGTQTGISFVLRQVL